MVSLIFRSTTSALSLWLDHRSRRTAVEVHRHWHQGSEHTEPGKALSPLVIIFLTVFIDLLGFGIIIPLLPFYAESFGASAFTIGLLEHGVLADAVPRRAALRALVGSHRPAAGDSLRPARVVRRLRRAGARRFAGA